MKMLSLVSLMVLAFTIFAPPARGDEPSTPEVPTIPQNIKLTPEMQAMLAELLKTLGTNQAGTPAPAGTPTGNVDANKLAPLISQLLKGLDSDQIDEPKPTPHPEPSPTASTGQKSQPASGSSTGLHTSSLRTGGLVTSTLNGTPRLTKEQWRELFPNHHN
jgi:hypothetical protein